MYKNINILLHQNRIGLNRHNVRVKIHLLNIPVLTFVSLVDLVLGLPHWFDISIGLLVYRFKILVNNSCRCSSVKMTISVQ